MSKPSKTKSRPQFTKAELKAYEARRAEEVHRVSMTASAADATGASAVASRRSYALSRDEEYAIIRSDLRRLLMILTILAVVLLAATVLLR